MDNFLKRWILVGPKTLCRCDKGRRDMHPCLVLVFLSCYFSGKSWIPRDHLGPPKKTCWKVPYNIPTIPLEWTAISTDVSFSLVLGVYGETWIALALGLVALGLFERSFDFEVGGLFLASWVCLYAQFLRILWLHKYFFIIGLCTLLSHVAWPSWKSGSIVHWHVLVLKQAAK